MTVSIGDFYNFIFSKSFINLIQLSNGVALKHIHSFQQKAIHLVPSALVSKLKTLKQIFGGVGKGVLFSKK